MNPLNRPASGKTIKDWIWHHVYSDTKYTALAKRMGEFFNLDDNKFYILTLRNGIPEVSEVKGET